MFNFLRIVRFPSIFLVVSGVMTGFYSAFFSGLALDKLDNLVQAIISAVFMVWGAAVWNELFLKSDDSNEKSKGVIPDGSMGSYFLIGSLFFIIALMLSMTVSMLSFFIVSAYIVLCFAYNALFRKIPVLGAVSFASMYVLVIVLGMSAHSYLVYLFTEPSLLLPLGMVFLYLSVLRVIRNLSIIDDSTEEEVEVNDYEKDSLELSTEVDSVYPGILEVDRAQDFDASCKISDRMIKRDMSIILPDSSKIIENPVTVKSDSLLMSVWIAWVAIILLLLIPVVYIFISNMSVFSVGAVILNVIYLIYPMARVVVKKNITSIVNLFWHGVVSVSILNVLVIACSADNLLTNKGVALVGVLVCMALSLMLLKKYFDKLI